MGYFLLAFPENWLEDVCFSTFLIIFFSSEKLAYCVVLLFVSMPLEEAHGWLYAFHLWFPQVDLSHFGSKVGVSYQNSKKLRKLIKQAIALKKCLEAHMKNHNPNKDSENLLDSLGHVIRIVTRYYEATRDLPFDWIKSVFHAYISAHLNFHITN